MYIEAIFSYNPLINDSFIEQIDMHYYPKNCFKGYLSKRSQKWIK